MRKNKAILVFFIIALVTSCSSNTKPQAKPDTCVIKMDTPEGNLPGKIEQSSGNGPECKAIERAIDKTI
ncbi:MULTISPECIES: thiamine biosynthesis protein ApbE [Providencia]|uniref:thiamine biosynthesis protein ApbE n=1 Tax=Providencia TaxID=586 RepID=UPI0012B50738|nr:MULTISPECIES: thiamine biosynthesis protein ApbE [Providencia]MTB45852.1 thiamine biosynthesis protein ApbE [Providencia sp. wls1950]MTC40958.1 thiamine biosynthesis protein ApbE [Providencia sp. wls1921]UBX48843.1 thiamine biosynthesis protein ApbE [Providencia alcalifaciens]